MTTTLNLVPEPGGVSLRIVTDLPTTTPLSVRASWEDQPPMLVRGLDALTGYPAALVVVDHAVPFNTMLTYEVVVGADYAVASIHGPEDSRAWVRDVLYPSMSMPLVISDHRAASTEARTALLTAVGRPNVLAVSDVRSGRTGTSLFATLTSREAQGFRDLIDSGHVLLLTGPWEWRLGPVYMTFLNVEEQRVGLAQAEERRWAVEWVQVDPPVALILGTPETYEECLVSYPTYLEWRARRYVDIAYPPSLPVVRRWTA